MKTLAELDRCQAFLDAQLRPGTFATSPATALRAITISRQAGCGATLVAERLAQLLRVHDKSAASTWTVFDRNLIEQVLKDHNLPVRLAKYLPEESISEIQDAIEQLFGLHPSTWTVVEHTAETILRLAQLGNVILIGRGANLITARLPGVFHVRLVAPLPQRIAHTQHFYDLSPVQARELVEREDKGKAGYYRRYFETDVDEALQYHLVINTGKISYDLAAEMIYTAATQMR